MSGPPQRIVGYRAKKNSLPIDLARERGALRWQEFWEPVHPEPGGRIVLEPGSPSVISGAEWADVSFPGFFDLLRSLGAEVELVA